MKLSRSFLEAFSKLFRTFFELFLRKYPHPFFRENKEYHQSEYQLPVEIHDDGAVDIIVKPGTRARVKDEAGKVLEKGYKYQVWLRPVIRPCKDTKQLPILDFVLVKVQDLKDMKEAGSKEKSGKDFLK